MTSSPSLPASGTTMSPNFTASILLTSAPKLLGDLLVSWTMPQVCDHHSRGRSSQACGWLSLDTKRCILCTSNQAVMMQQTRAQDPVHATMLSSKV